MTRNGKIGFGLVGTGMAGAIHAREFPFVEGAELVAVCSRDETKLEKFADEFGVKHRFTDYRALVDSPEVDVVVVLLPTGLHREVALYASNAGKQLIVEKPLDVNLERADDILLTCRQNGTKLGVIFQMRFGAVARHLKQVVSSGALGRIFLADAFDKSSRTAAYYNSAAWRGTMALEGGGCLMTQSIHIVDLLQYVVGPVKSVVGKVATKVHAIEVEDTATALLQFENGAMGVLESTSSVRPALKSNLQLHGENGTIVANAQYDQILFWDVKGYDCPMPIPPNVQLGDIDDPWSYPQTRHRIQLQDMVDAIRENRQPILSGQEARLSLAINMAIYESSRTGREISLLEPPLRRAHQSAQHGGHAMTAKQVAEISPIAYSSLTETVYKAIKEKILNHEIPMGSRIRDELLAEQLGVSRTPIREALRALIRDGLVEVVPRSRTRVRNPTDQDIVRNL